MIKLSLGIGIVASLLLMQSPPEPSVPAAEIPGPFSNSGQVILAVLMVIVPVVTRMWDNRVATQRESEKEARALEREKAKDELALKQRAMDEAKADRQRDWDLKDRQMAREEAALRREEEAAAVKRELEAAKRLLAVKVEETAKATTASHARVVSEVGQVLDLVNGSHTALLEKVERLTRQLAAVTGRKDDHVEAAEAKKEVKDEKAITAEHEEEK